MRKGLDRQTIIQTSLRMIEQEGKDAFSLHRLADALGVKTASLYNHVSGFHALMDEICIEVIHMLVQTEEDAIRGKSGDAAIRDLANAYFRFGAEHYELYQIFMASRKPVRPEVEREGVHIIDPILQTFEPFRLSREEKIHWERILRSLLHGFITQEHAGFFTFHDVSSEESFRRAIQYFLAGIHLAESAGSAGTEETVESEATRKEATPHD